MIKAQAEANAETTERAAMAEVQKQEATANTELQIEKGKSQFAIEKLQAEAAIKRQLAEQQFNYDMQLEQLKANSMMQKQQQIIQREAEREAEIENRKDKRAKIVGTQQSAMIGQRQNKEMPIDFEADKGDSMQLVQSMMGPS